MRKILFLTLLGFGFSFSGKTQQIDSIYFHLYTDSLKKGVHNYINVDGKLSNGSWLPLSSREVDFSSNLFRFAGNELVIPWDTREEKVKIRAVLKSRPEVVIEREVWIKKMPDPELPDQVPGSRQRKKSGS